MKTRMRNWILLIIFLPLVSMADNVYMKKNSDGSVVYSDVQMKGSTPLDVSPNNTVSVPDFPKGNDKSDEVVISEATSSVDSASVGSRPYTEFKIKSPIQQETIQNQPSFKVMFQIEPELQKGDSVQLYVDGKSWGGPVQLSSIDVAQLERGSHTIYGTLIDKDNRVIRQSPTVTIYVHRASKVTSPAFNPK